MIKLKYFQLTEDLKGQILSGQILPGEKYLPRIPWQRSMASAGRPFGKPLRFYRARDMCMPSTAEALFVQNLRGTSTVPEILQW